jgi:copper homeostasis protein CutC
MLIEIAVYSIETALIAQHAGDDRIELCCAPAGLVCNSHS